MKNPYNIGDGVSLSAPRSVVDGGGVYKIVQRSDLESSDPSYVIQSETHHRLRREFHSRLKRVPDKTGDVSIWN
ncbi:hypothetical protein HDIA_1483 [Hartmannibacter diazotrophicus]|uniref:Uncharacterized protein n=1 Tax=Hartmannibacter diazotrophicus TaxID=1482074 RepID=A0A2C9D412_9HYPH|nr:hypothetical protein [Hartmannibacter diazotrophicus]SON55024.1 hypothetical protein HDIA_1483 [Hartmannibacter diazotrophicus]